MTRSRVIELIQPRLASHTRLAQGQRSSLPSGCRQRHTVAPAPPPATDALPQSHLQDVPQRGANARAGGDLEGALPGAQRAVRDFQATKRACPPTIALRPARTSSASATRTPRSRRTRWPTPFRSPASGSSRRSIRSFGAWPPAKSPATRASRARGVFRASASRSRAKATGCSARRCTRRTARAFATARLCSRASALSQGQRLVFLGDVRCYR